MGSVTKFAALYTKTRALESQLLTTADYLNLLEAPNEDTVIDYLTTKTVYGENMYTYGSDEPRSVLFERALRQFLFDRYEQMMHYLIDEDRRLFKTLLMRYEVESIKMAIRSVYSGVDLSEEDIEGHIVTSKHFTVQDFSKLFTARSVEDIVNYLMDTPYGELLKPYLGESRRRMLFYLEMNLDRYYFKQLMDRIATLKGEGKTYMQTALGTNIDFLNIQWIYRGINNYDIQPDELFNYCLSGGLHLSLKKLRELCYLETPEALLKALVNTHYGALFSGEHNIDLVLEREMDKELYKLFNEQLQKAHFNLIAPVGYLHKLEFEIKDLFAILEAKRYGMNAAQTKGFLVREINLQP